MHRSGTSLLADLLGRAGVSTWAKRLVAANPHNPRGHFEDEDFVALHDAILSANGTNWAATNCPDTLHISPETPRACNRDLCGHAMRSSCGGGRIRGRRCFSTSGANCCLRARFVFVFSGRPSWVVARRCGDGWIFDLLYQGRGAWTLHQLGLGFLRFRLQAAIDAWLHYNRAVIAFVERNRDVCHVMDLGALSTQFPRLLRVMRGFLALSSW